METKEEALQDLRIDAPPSLLIVGKLLQYDEILIVAEGEVVLNISGGHLSALKCLISLFYTLNFCYPKAYSITYIFIQKCVLQILDTNHTPTKVTVFVNEINKWGSHLSMKTKYSDNCWFLINVHSQNIHVAARIAIAVLGLPHC